MADIFNLGTYGTGGSSIGQTPSDRSTGDLRRRYNFGNRISELAIAQDPFFRMVSKLSKKPVDDPQFKFTERRPSFHKRYAYVALGGDGDYSDALSANLANCLTAGDVIKLRMGTDYASAGNLSNVYGKAPDYVVGASGTYPEFFLQGQLLRVPISSAANAGGDEETYSDYIVAMVDAVTTNGEYADLTLTVKRGSSQTESGAYWMGPPSSVAVGASGTTSASQETLEKNRCYVVGSAFEQGSGYPETWKDQPFSTSFGNTQIWKTAMAMDNTTRATVLKFEGNEWARIWREKLIEHKWDIEQSLLWNSQGSTASTAWTTDGVVNYITAYGNQFTLPLATKKQDDFLDDLSAFLDPRYNNANATLFFVGTEVYNWLHKLSGYFQNNLEISPNFTSSMAMSGKKKVFGVDITTISTPYGDMNVARNIHLDGSDIGILACNMKYVSYRPLVGNGLNRDTAIYVGVQTLENSGVDRRVDLIQTEAGLELQMPEAHAIWTKS